MFLKKATAALCILYTSATYATPIFSDNFDTDKAQFNATVFDKNWTVKGGSVDVQGANFYDLMPNNGHYIDLDGSTNNAGLFSNSISLVANQTYTLSFDLAGNHRNAGIDTVNSYFGNSQQTFKLNANDSFKTFSIDYTPSANGIYSFGFRDQGHDNQGALLDRVSISAAVPEPETYAMMLGGLALLGLTLRRSRANSV